MCGYYIILEILSQNKSNILCCKKVINVSSSLMGILCFSFPLLKIFWITFLFALVHHIKLSSQFINLLYCGWNNSHILQFSIFVLEDLELSRVFPGTSSKCLFVIKASIRSIWRQSSTPLLFYYHNEKSLLTFCALGRRFSKSAPVLLFWVDLTQGNFIFSLWISAWYMSKEKTSSWDPLYAFTYITVSFC